MNKNTFGIASITLLLIVVAACGSHPPSGGGSGGGVIGQNGASPNVKANATPPPGALLTKDDAIGAAIAFLHAPKQRTESETQRLQCNQYDLDADPYHSRCMESPPGSGMYYKEVTTERRVTVPNL